MTHREEIELEIRCAEEDLRDVQERLAREEDCCMKYEWRSAIEYDKKELIRLRGELEEAVLEEEMA